MNAPEPYFPQALFAGDDQTTPRVFIAPQRYIQGNGVLDKIGQYLSLLKSQNAGILISKRGQQADGVRVVASLEAAAIDSVVATFTGECSLQEIDQHAAALRDRRLDCLIAVGGGKCVDAGKAIAYRLDIPIVVVPTLASNDAPTSTVSVLYTAEGISSGAEFYPQSPAMVIIDTGVIANASPRYLSAGMGDAMATWYEARICIENPKARSVLGARSTLASAALGEICAATLFKDGQAALKAVEDSRVDNALESVVEANTLLSGIGFESGGIAVAHAIAQSYTHIAVVHDNYLHGEMVAMGTLVQLMMEGGSEAKAVAEFFAKIGLPIHLGQLSLSSDDTASLDILIAATMQYPTTHNMPMEVTAETLRSAILDAHQLGLKVESELGDKTYRRLHGS